MTPDHELLDWAAKAAGFELVDGCVRKDDIWVEWNPLTDDGDALRLAVKCLPFITLRYTREDWEKSGEDGYAATRRAIVRAAAEIGRSMT